jgi:HEAT repeat protein
MRRRAIALGLAIAVLGASACEDEPPREAPLAELEETVVAILQEMQDAGPAQRQQPAARLRNILRQRPELLRRQPRTLDHLLECEAVESAIRDGAKLDEAVAELTRSGRLGPKAARSVARTAALTGRSKLELAELMLAAGDEEARETAVELLAALGGRRVVEPLARAMDDSSWSVRLTAADALGDIADIGHQRAMAVLAAALQDEDDSVRKEAAGSLAALGDQRSVEPLLQALEDESESVRSAAAESLGIIADARAVGALSRALQDDSSLVRRRAAESLGAIADARAVKPLIAALRDEDYSVRTSAADALVEIGDQRAVSPMIEMLEPSDAGSWQDEQAAHVAELLGRLRAPQALQPLMRALRHEQPRVRARAAAALGMLGDARALQPLVTATGDQRWSVRHAAAGALGRLGGGPAVKPLSAALQDADSRVAAAAAAALGETGRGRAVGPLLGALRQEDQDPEVFRNAALALGAIGSARAVGPLIEALEKKGWPHCKAPAQALQDIGSSRAVAPAMALLEAARVEQRECAAYALGLLEAEPAAAQLAAAWKKEDAQRLRVLLAWALVKTTGRTDPLETLSEALDHAARMPSDAGANQAAIVAAWALGSIGQERALQPLLEALHHRAVRVRIQAAEALGALGDMRAVGPLIDALDTAHVATRAAAALRRLSGEDYLVEPARWRRWAWENRKRIPSR